MGEINWDMERRAAQWFAKWMRENLEVFKHVNQQNEEATKNTKQSGGANG